MSLALAASAMAELSLSALFSRALENAAKSLHLPTIENSAQDLIASVLQDLALVNVRVNELSLFSPNETLEDISTPHLVYLFVPFVAAEVQSRVKAFKREERTAILGFCQKHAQSFTRSLEDYDIVSPEDRKLASSSATSIKDPAKRRETKITQYKAEKDIRAHIETLRKKRGQQDSSSESEFAMIASLLPRNGSTTSNDDEEEDQSTEDILRQSTLLVLRLCYKLAYSQLESLAQELDLLRTAPLSPPQNPLQDPRDKEKQLEADMWKLDLGPGPSKQGPLLDNDSRPLRPFTILPSGASDRQRFQSQVFGPGHNLPTMTIDEYLEIERQRGNIITGGGPQSLEKPTTSEQLALDAEMDGSKDGEEKAEQKRQKDERWAQFTDANPRGAGNTMNRG